MNTVSRYGHLFLLRRELRYDDEIWWGFSEEAALPT